MITDVDGVLVGHWSDEIGKTGCTVVILPPRTTCSGEVRGGAPGTREWALLSPEKTVAHVDAVVLSGGSAFGLAACDGVMSWLDERGRGVETPAGRVPIVIGMVLYDLAVGDPKAHPDRAAGYAAAAAARGGPFSTGSVGAGTGATIGKWSGRENARPGGIGTATIRDGDLMVSALMAVNAFGDLADGTARRHSLTETLYKGHLGEGLLSSEQKGQWSEPKNIGGGEPRSSSSPINPLEATTIGVVATNAALDKLGCYLVSQSAHDGLARALEPAHTSVDGDALVTASTGPCKASLDTVRFYAARAVEAAIRDAIRPVFQGSSGT